jgi:hypothetical protein
MHYVNSQRKQYKTREEKAEESRRKQKKAEESRRKREFQISNSSPTLDPSDKP